ncbi:uncharacterized protein LOC135154503 [Lytechinus pictus]|uniref:uncharacterized protein LOC135154503 n=1 Tax=Lytechinus pictus TaxID=7653 RepID=UPI0030B9F5B0
MNWEATDLPEEFQLFRQRMELILADQDITDQRKVSMKIKIAVGNEGLRRINASGLSETDKEKPQELWRLLEAQLKVNINFRIHRLELMRYRQKTDETIDEFVTRCRDKAKNCDFEEAELNERIMEPVIASTPSLEFQKSLLDQPKDSPFNVAQFDTIHTSGPHTVVNPEGTVAFANIDIICPQRVGQYTLYLKVDSGASANTITVRTAKAIYGRNRESVVKQTTIKLIAYGEIPIPCKGTLDIKFRYKSTKWSAQTFYVADVNGPAILGMLGCTDLGIITIHSMHDKTPTSIPQPKQTPITSVRNLKQEYLNQFDAIGSFQGKAMLHVKDDAKPTIDAPRKCSVHLKDKIKAKLDNMEQQRVIRKIEYHTDWCSSMTTVVKKDGSIRICLDPRRLNDALKRCPHKVPTLGEVQPVFAGAQYFSKLDAKAGYLSVHLSEECQDLTTFRTPFGRYCFQRLSFGLCTSQDIFQQRMDRIFQNVPGCICIADDIAIVGRTEEEHDRNLYLLMETAKQEGLVFNSSKCTIKKEAINFFGSKNTRSGIYPDPSKVEAITSMPSPKDKKDVQRSLGLFTYLAAYIPNFSEKSAPLRELLQKEVPFIWDDDHEHSLNSPKSTVSSGACLQFYDPKKETTLDVDASMKGLGTCLLQQERETLAVVFGINRFHKYLFGKEFTVITHHRPLEMIWKKPLRSAPPRLQRLLIKVQGYRSQVKYRPRKDMIISDTLSRLHNPKEARDVPLDVRVESICSEAEDSHQIDLIYFGQHKRTELQRETANDHVLRSLWQIVTQGWPETIQELPTSLRQFWSYRDEIGVSHGVLFKGSQVIILKTLRNDILRQLHLGHMGIVRQCSGQKSTRTLIS